MSDLYSEIDIAFGEVEALRKTISKKKGVQVYSNDEKLAIKGVALAWFKKHKPVLANTPEQKTATVDQLYAKILEESDKNATRKQYLLQLKALKKLLIDLRTQVLQTDVSLDGQDDTSPDFSALISDDKMRRILQRRWSETLLCIQSKANLAAMVMMGGLLEGLLLTRIHRISDKSVVFKSRSAPRGKDGKTLQLKDWGLQNFLEVANELRWITQTAGQVGSVIRDYRNYIHPEKEYSQGEAVFSEDDIQMIWGIFKNMTRQIVRVSSNP